MKYYFSFVALISVFSIFSQEELLFQKPSASILQLADYERPPSISMDNKKQMVLFSYRDTYKTLQDLNQEELRLDYAAKENILHVLWEQEQFLNKYLK